MTGRILLRTCLVTVSLIALVFVAELVARWYEHNNNKLFTEVPGNKMLLKQNPHCSFSAVDCDGISFIKQKSSNTFRIFVAGAPSFAAGNNIAQNPGVGFTHHLRKFLSEACPEQNIELIHLDLVSGNSFIHREISQQLAGYQADAVILFPGNDEFYGKYSYTRNQLTGNVFLDSKLLKLALIRSVLNRGRKVDQPSEGIDCHSEAFRNATAMFEENLDETVQMLKKKGIAVILINTVANLKDMPPQISCFSSPGASWLNDLFQEGISAYKQGSHQKAYSCFAKIARKDPTHAATRYYLGKYALLEGKTSLARSYFAEARENDWLRLRSSGEINRIILKTSLLHGCPITEPGQIFEKMSADGVPGNEFFNGPDMNLNGNTITARECFKTLADAAIITPEAGFNLPNDDEPAWNLLYDRYCANSMHEIFPDETPGMSLPVLTTTFEEKVFEGLVMRKSSRNDTLGSLYSYYLSQENFQKAFLAAQQLAFEDPYNMELSRKAYKTAAYAGNYSQTVHFATRCFKAGPDADSARHLIVAHLCLDQPAKAIPYLEYLKKITGSDHLSQLHATVTEIMQLRNTLQSGPENRLLREKLARLYRSIGNEAVARKYAS